MGAVAQKKSETVASYWLIYLKCMLHTASCRMVN